MPSPIIFASSPQRIFGVWRERGILKRTCARGRRLQQKEAVLAFCPVPHFVRFHAGGQAAEVDLPKRWRCSRKRKPSIDRPERKLWGERRASWAVAAGSGDAVKPPPDRFDLVA